MKLFNALEKPKYFLLAVVSSLIFVFVYIYLQVLGNLDNIGAWFKLMPWYNAFLFIVFLVLFGITFSFQIYSWLHQRKCSLNRKLGGAGTTGIGTTGLFFVIQCPACVSFVTLFLPFSVIGFLSQYSWLISLFSIGLLLFTLNYLGAFKKE
jgi:hypothetical protein